MISLTANHLRALSADPRQPLLYISGMRRRRLSKQVIASRKNGKVSRGPKTPEGKRRSSANSLRHGLLAKCVVLKNESQPIFSLVLDQHLEKLNPADDVEHGLVEEMVAAAWRMRRLWAIETTALNNAVDKRTESSELARLAAAFSDLARGNDLHLLDRYETRLHRMYQRSLHNLVLLRQLDSPADEPLEMSLLPNEPGLESTPAETETYVAIKNNGSVPPDNPLLSA
jgi:hypothetical protein